MPGSTHLRKLPRTISSTACTGIITAAAGALAASLAALAALLAASVATTAAVVAADEIASWTWCAISTTAVLRPGMPAWDQALYAAEINACSKTDKRPTSVMMAQLCMP